MFEEFLGLPAHPLLLHAAVIFVPLLALTAVGYAFVPFLRPHLRLVLAGLSVLGAGAAVFARLSGDAFFDRMKERNRVTEGFIPVIENHQSYGHDTMWAAIALGVVSLALVYFVAPRGAALSYAGPRSGSRAVSVTLAVLTLVAAAIALYYIYQTGDSGARAVWEGQ